MPGFGGAGGSPWGNAPPAIADWLNSNWGDWAGGGFKGPPPGLPGPALPPAAHGGFPRSPLLSGRVPLGAGSVVGGVGVGRNPGDPMNTAQRLNPVPMSNPPPPNSLLAALFSAKGPLPPPGFPGAPTGLPMGVRSTGVGRNPVDYDLLNPANRSIQGTPVPNAQFDQLFGNMKPFYA